MDPAVAGQPAAAIVVHRDAAELPGRQDQDAKLVCRLVGGAGPGGPRRADDPTRGLRLARVTVLDRRRGESRNIMRSLSIAVVLVLLAGLGLVVTAGPAAQGDQAWGTIKGQVVWGNGEVPQPKLIKVDKD